MTRDNLRLAIPEASKHTVVIVCGGREPRHDEETTRAALREVFAALHQRGTSLNRPTTLVVTGGARGEDTRAHDWARAEGYPTAVMDANWEVYGRPKAGPLRNEWMLRFMRPNVVVALPGGTGTRDMVNKARAAGGITVVEVSTEAET